MTDLEIEMNPAEFLTIGTVGPKGQRVFYLQAASGDVLVSLIVEKEQARALGEAIEELLDDLDSRFPTSGPRRTPFVNMDLREPITPRFRVAQMGLGYDEDRDLVVLVAHALNVATLELDEEEDEEEQEADEALNPFDLLGGGSEDEEEGAVARIWCSRPVLRALGERAAQVVAAGRPDPRQNGRLIYYWT